MIFFALKLLERQKRAAIAVLGVSAIILGLAVLGVSVITLGGSISLAVR